MNGLSDLVSLCHAIAVRLEGEFSAGSNMPEDVMATSGVVEDETVIREPRYHVREHDVLQVVSDSRITLFFGAHSPSIPGTVLVL